MKLPSLNLDKEKLQRLMLVGMVLAGLLYAGWAFLISPLHDDTRKVEGELTKMRGIYRDNQRLVASRRLMQKRYDEARASFNKVIHDTLAPPVNGMAWATDVFRAVATDSDPGARPVSIGELGTLVAPPTSREAAPPVFEEYLVRADHQCGYNAFGRFLAALERTNPCVRLDGLEIRATEEGNRSRRIQINLRTAFLRFDDLGFPPEERPDAETPRVLPKEAKNKEATPASP